MIYISNSNKTDFCGFETSETFFMLVSKQMKPDKVGFETNDIKTYVLYKINITIK